MAEATPESALLADLRGLGTATLSMQLLKRGLRAVWMAGPRPLDPAARIAGPAFTLRFIPQREDVATPESYASPDSLRAAIEAMPPGAVAVIDARGETGAGTLGDILAARMAARGVAGAVSDGALRDVAGVRAAGLAVWCAGAAAPPSIGRLFFADWQRPIGCGGVAVWPGDYVVADADGALVVPRDLAEAVARDGAAQDRFERFVQRKVAEGRPVTGLYPPDAATLEEYARWRED